MKKLLFSLLFIGFCFTATAQDYDMAVGFRLGYGSGITVKKVLNTNASLEGIIDFRYRGFAVTGLYEVNRYDVFDVDRLNWYFGAGAHVGSYRSFGTFVNCQDCNDNTFFMGLDGILGIEYNFTEVPINVSLDWKPALNLAGLTGFWGDNGALSARYYF